MPFPIISSWSSVQSDIIDRYVTRRSGGDDSGDSKDIGRSSLKHLYREINERLKSPVYKDLSAGSMIATLRYVYWETRAGIFVSVRNGKLEAFLPFANARYRNDWSKELTFAGVAPSSKQPVKDYMAFKKKMLGHSRRMMSIASHWWANRNFLNVEARPDVWGQHSLQEYFEMISAALEQHSVADVMFVINKRDHPILRKDLRKPYGFLYRGEAPFIEKPSKSYAPIVTSYSNPAYLDIPIPIVQDWTIATKPEQYYPIAEDVPWNRKQDTAFFRGAATGPIRGNQRIHLAELDRDWRASDRDGFLDAGLTSWNLSDKIDSGGLVEFLVPKQMEARGIRLKAKLPMDQQVRYKYLLNVDGHTAPNRTSWILKSGSLMLLVGSSHLDCTWIDNNLKAWEHYVPIKADLSDLEEQIQWCRSHDDECQRIVKRAKVFARQYFNRDTIASYMAYMMNRIAANKDRSS